jgi:hypothetical protein
MVWLRCGCDCDGKKRGPPSNGERAGLLIIPALNAPHPPAETTWPRDGGGTHRPALGSSVPESQQPGF